MLATTSINRTASQATTQTAQPADGWQREMKAMRDLESTDVELFLQTAKAVRAELADVQRVYEIVSEKFLLRRSTIDISRSLVVSDFL